MTRIYLLRHGETEWNHQGNRYCGITDISLNAQGERQAHLTGYALRSASITAVYCSPLQRSRQTASIIGQMLNLVPTVDERLYEIDFGLWEGLSRREIEETYGPEWAAWTRDTDTYRAGTTGNTGAEIAQRYQLFANEQSAKHAEESILIIGHNTANRLFITATLDLPCRKYRSITQHNCGISIADRLDEEYVWIQINGTAHLATNG
ncbi:histidine phosphatase family protein [Cohnella soli]|uniref:Histidine phosphatase family protein n=1 Tax=Cohnella soli TaxID=425005 RepID=A0ABW0HWZ7_9BACL